MIAWLERNKEWLLSGVGVTFLLVIYASLKRAITSLRRSSKADPPPFDQVKFRTHPLPREITNAIDSAPPLHRDSRSHEYLGVRVQWLTTLHNASLWNEEIRLMLRDRGGYPWIYALVPKDLYPDLSLAKRDTSVWIAGTISKFGDGGITLEQVELRIAL